jgi:hypothetical protein
VLQRRERQEVPLGKGLWIEGKSMTFQEESHYLQRVGRNKGAPVRNAW